MLQFMAWFRLWEEEEVTSDHVFVSTAAAVDENDLVLLHALGELHAVVNGVRWF